MKEIDQPNSVHGDPEKALPLFAEFTTAHRYFLEQLSKQTDKTFEINKQLVSYYERLLLIDLGIISLSLTQISSAAAKLPPPLFHRGFVLLVAPSWISLIISALYCRSIMAMANLDSQHAHQRLNTAILKYQGGILGKLMKNLKEVLSGTVTANDKQVDLKEWLGNAGIEIQRETNELGKSTELPELNHQRWKIHERIAELLMYAGLILLCIAAIRLFLTV